MIFLGLALMPCSDMMYLSSFPFGTPKNTFFGIQSDVEPSELRERRGEVCDQVASLSHFDHYVMT